MKKQIVLCAKEFWKKIDLILVQESPEDAADLIGKLREEKEVLERQLHDAQDWYWWRDVSVHGYPEKPCEVLFRRDNRTLYGAYIGDRFWYNNEPVAVLYWMPLPTPLIDEASI